MNFGKYLDKVEVVLKAKYCIDLFDTDIDFNEIADAQENAMSPEDFVNWFGTKFNLIENDTLSNN
jgi:hypothetical protein